jgi:flagella basal body P-ring formation protein FlgA
VDPETLVLEWGEPRSGALPEDFDRVSLLGTGRDGRWVASFAPEQGDADHQSVLLRAGVVVPQTVAGRRLERGETVGEEDMVLESRIHWGAPRGLPDPCQAGWVTQRPVEVGDLLSPPAVKPPLMVVSGRPVTLHWSQGKVELSLRGTAVGSAALGERVFVRTDAGTRLDGWVEGPGRVRISGKPKESGR